MNLGLKVAYYFMTIVTLNLFLSFEYHRVNAIEFEDLDIDYVNGDYFNMSNLEISVNRKKNAPNTVNLNIQVIKEFSNEFNVKCSGTTRAFGYQIPSGLNFHSKVCQSDIGKILYDILVTAAGVKDCPPKKGLYQMHDLHYDFGRVNVTFISGARLQFTAEIFNDDVTKLAQFRFFVLT